MQEKGNLYLIPCTLGEADMALSVPTGITNVINGIDTYIVENERSARRYLKKAGIKKAIDDLTFNVLNKHTDPHKVAAYLNPCTAGADIGLISEAGCPAIADPGAEIVKRAHEESIRIIPLVGPSSILLALMASGMNGQNFCFNGYLPIERGKRIDKLKELERNASTKGQTQIFIETPYRNQKLLMDLLASLNDNTRLCIATDITLGTEFIKTLPVKEWKKETPAINKRPTIFLLF